MEGECMKKYKIGMAISQFYPDFATLLKQGADRVLQAQANVKVVSYTVPGCSELPLMAHWLFRYQKVSAVIVLGVVIRGQTSHYESVCRILEQGIVQTQLHWSKPVINGVIMAESTEQVQNRLSSQVHKGVDSAKACCDMLKSFSSIH